MNALLQVRRTVWVTAVALVLVPVAGVLPAHADDAPPPVEIVGPVIGVPAIAGTPRVGEVLTADPGAWDPTLVLSYQWSRDGVALPGATGSSYLVVPADAGASLTVTVTGASEGVEPTSATSDPTAPVALGLLTAPVPTIAGTARVGVTLTARPGTWAPAATVTYQWYRSGTAISGATKPTYTLAAADLGKRLTVAVTGSSVGYATATTTSAATAAVASGTLTTVVPTISGTAAVGRTLTARPGTWAPSATFSYQWYRSGTAISGATKSTYVLVAADLGKTVTVKVTGSRSGYATVTKSSAATAKVISGTLTAPTPVISTPRVGAKTTVTLGTWTAGTARTYRWYVAGKAVAGSRGTASTLTPTAAERGKSITVKVTGTKAGYTTVAKTAAKKTIGYGTFTTAPTPKITGTAKVGSTLTAVRGSWAPAPTSWTYQWKANGTAIAGATRSTFTPTSAQRGKTITVTVTAKRTGYASKAMTSATTAAVVQAFAAAPTPKITGTVRVGSTLTATVGTWSPAPTLSYQWKANGTAIAGATGRTFTLTSAQQGKTITVTVTGKAAYRVTTSRTSSATAKVTWPPLTATQTKALADAKTYLSIFWFSRKGLIDQLVYDGYTTKDATTVVDRTGTSWNAEAAGSAKSYLDYMPFSRAGLVDQLVYDGFTASQAEYGVAHSGANWLEQAWRCAEWYLDYYYLTWDEMVGQLIYEGFTSAQAAYGATMAGL